MGSLFKRLKDLLTDVGTGEGIDDSRSLPMAATMLLFEVAWADHDISDEEIESIRASLRALFSLPEADVNDMIEQARSQIQDSTSVFPFTHKLTQHLNFEEKRHLMLTLWQLALADHEIKALEEHTIRRLADLLYVPHSSFINAKLTAKSKSKAEE